MNKQEIQSNAVQIVQREIRSGKLGRYADTVRQWLPKIASAVDTDKDLVMDCVKSAVKGSNPLNSVLGVFGIQFVSEKSLEKSPASKNVLDRALSLDEHALQDAIRGMSKALEEIDADIANQEKETQAENSKLHAQLDTMRQEKDRVQSSYQAQQKRVAERLQYMLALMGQVSSEDPVYQQIQEMVADLNAKVVWDSENGPLPVNVMFQFYKADNPDECLKKPCLVCGEMVLVQGVLFEQA